MSKQIIIAEQHRIAAVFSEDQIQELIVATGSHQVGDIYLGIVENVLPSIDAAFVNIGDSERNGFIHVSDLGPVRLKRSAGAITELLAPQQKVLIQVMKEPTGNKGPRLTGNISLPGRYLVLMPFGRGVNLSRRIRNDSERDRLRALGILIKPPGMGLLIRTEAEGVSEKAIIEDLEALQKHWESIQQQASATRAPALLGRDDDFIQRVLRDIFTSEVNRIVVDSAMGLKRVKHQLTLWNGNKLPAGVLIDHHRESIPILEYFRVNAAIREALKPRVDLPSGGYIIIEPTEALTVIDVNSGSFTRSATARETVLWTNSEAATEIARQLRLRNIAGVIIVDFIDMDSRRDQLQVLEHFSKALKADKSRPQIAQLSELGLVELTRKRQGQNVYELFGRNCSTCGGLGHLVHLPGEPEDSNGEIVERVLPTRSLDYAPRQRTPESPDLRSEEFAPDGNEDGPELDLVNHPNYQERSGSRRRRGRHQRPYETTPKGGPRTMPQGRASEVAPRTEESLSPLPLVPVEAAKEVIDLPVNGERLELPERPRPGQPLTKSKQEPPESLSVVMTAEEQQVYALMGLSPIVLYNGAVKNPRSAIVSVALPGQEPVPPPAPNPRSAVKDALSEEKSFTPAALTLAPEAEEETDLEDPSLEPLSKPDSEENGNGSTLIRRRRRRSSANPGEQLSLETEA